jgi:hypothetical protein
VEPRQEGKRYSSGTKEISRDTGVPGILRSFGLQFIRTRSVISRMNISI